MVDFEALEPTLKPFPHWVARDFVSRETVRQINAGWPWRGDGRWCHENGKLAKKSAMQFPRRLSPEAQDLAQYLYSPQSCKRLSEIIGISLEPDPWFTDGAMTPRLGGGLHEIYQGGLLKMHVDFNRHPTGLTRSLNLLVYLNETWCQEWGGAIQLGFDGTEVLPVSGTAVMFETSPDSWHGHPQPLACPDGVTRRSLALYYYTRGSLADRDTTVYKK